MPYSYQLIDKYFIASSSARSSRIYLQVPRLPTGRPELQTPRDLSDINIVILARLCPFGSKVARRKTGFPCFVWDVKVSMLAGVSVLNNTMVKNS